MVGPWDLQEATGVEGVPAVSADCVEISLGLGHVIFWGLASYDEDVLVHQVAKGWEAPLVDWLGFFAHGESCWIFQVRVAREAARRVPVPVPVESVANLDREHVEKVESRIRSLGYLVALLAVYVYCLVEFFTVVPSEVSRVLSEFETVESPRRHDFVGMIVDYLESNLLDLIQELKGRVLHCVGADDSLSQLLTRILSNFVTKSLLLQSRPLHAEYPVLNQSTHLFHC